MTGERRDALVLLASCALAFAPYLPWLGFYVDDWTQLLDRLSSISDQSLPGLVRGFNDELFYLRPLNLLYYPLTYWLGGFSAWRYQLMYLAMDSLGALFIYRALRESSGDGALAWLAALLYALYPNHAGARFWNNQIHPAHFFFATGMLAYARQRTALCLLLLAVSGLHYEAYLPLFLLAPLLDRLRHRPATKAWPVLALAAGLAAYTVLIQHVYPQTFSRKLLFDPGFALGVIGKGLECSTTGILHLFWTVLPDAGKLPWPLLLALIPAAVFLVGKSGPTSLKGAALRAWCAGAAVLLVAGYLPYALSADRYAPHIFDLQNRLNAAPSLGAAMLLAAGLSRLRGRTGAAAIAAVLAAFLFIDWQEGRAWAEAARVQTEILEEIRAKRPAGPALIILDAPPQIERAPMFQIDVEFDAALRLLVSPNLRGSRVGDGVMLSQLAPNLPRLIYRPGAGLSPAGGP